MNKIVLTAIPILLAMLACSDMIPLGPSTAKCSYVLKEHPTEMINIMSVNCPFKANCKIDFLFGPVSYTEGCLDDFEYLYKKGSYEKKVHMNTHVDMSLDSDDHVRFSLFDSKNVEKTYDIDLSEIIHSYSILGDSVEITLPDFVERAAIYRSKGPGAGIDVIELVPDSILNGKYFFLLDDLYVGDYYISYGMNSQSSLKTDSIFVSADVFFK